MTEKNLKEFQETLSRHHDNLLKLVQDKSEGKPIHLEGTTVKDMLKAVSQFKEALEKIDEGTFGLCKVCHEDVELDRLYHDFTTDVCLSHYSDEEIKRLEKDLELTAELQRKLMPCCDPLIKDLQFAHFSRPAGIVSGDFYDFFTFGDNLQGIIIADVMGKGLPAGILMANLQAALKILGPQVDSLDELAKDLNQFFRNNIKVMGFISLCLVSLNTDKGIFEYCNAGHHPPLFRDDDKNEIHWLKPTGPAIGIIQDGHFEVRNFEIAENDLLLLYTDGLVEARNDEGEEFGDERLYSYVQTNFQKPAQQFLDGLIKDAVRFSAKFHDDLTMMVVKM